ncbi:MAG: DUF6177 family protein [Pseudonocardiaceae bacterium]
MRHPAGWGLAEPVTQPWSPREITAHCRERAPTPTQVVVVGPGLVGQLHVERVDTGVLERIRFSGPRAGTVGQDVIDALAAEVAGTAACWCRLDDAQRAPYELLTAVLAHFGLPGAPR